MLTFAFTALVLGVQSVALYFAYRYFRSEFWRVVREQAKRQRRQVVELRADIKDLAERTARIEVSGFKQPGEIKPRTNLKQQMEDRYVKELNQPVSVNGEPQKVG